jgi:hypothetical protein
MDDEIMVLALIFLVVIIPVTLGVGSDLVKRWLEHREKQLELMAERSAEKAAQYAEKVERLEARMQVLERIATDRGQQLAMEIEDLRLSQDRERLQ